MTLEGKIIAALAERQKVVDECPATKTSLMFKPCPKCGATRSEPCREGVRADAIFLDTIKEIVG